MSGATRVFAGLILVGAIGGWWMNRSPAAPVALGVDGRPATCIAPAGTVQPTPRHVRVPSGVSPFQIARATVTPRAGLLIEARVLSTQRYQSGREATWSPLDLALGWDRMADPAVYGPLGISQSGRWFHYRWGPEGPPIPLDEIVASASNMHMIPADEAVAARLLALSPGQRVRLRGWLVDLSTPDGYRWSTSLRFDDSGNGACEIVYVCSVEVAP